MTKVTVSSNCDNSKMNFSVCNLCDPSGVSNALTFDNANACSCEFFPCVHDLNHGKLSRRKRSEEMQSLIENESLDFNGLNMVARTSVNETSQRSFDNNNVNEVFYAGEPIDVDHKFHIEGRKEFDGSAYKNSVANNGGVINRSKTAIDFPDINRERSLVHGGSESSIPSFYYRRFGGIFAWDTSSNVYNSVMTDIQYCRHVYREVKRQELGQYLKVKKKKEESSDSNSSDSDSDQSSSSSETTSSESSDSSCSSSSSTSSTSSSSDEDDSSSESDSSEEEEDADKMRPGKKQKSR